MASRSRHDAWDEADIDFGVARHEAQSRALAFDHADEFYPGEPIAGPVRQRSRIRTVSYIVMLGISGWGMIQTSAVWRPWLDKGVAIVSAELERRQATDQAAATATAITPPPANAPLEPLSMAKDVAEVAGTALNPPGAEPVAQPGTSEATASPAAPDAAVETPPQNSQPAPLPEPQIDPGDPYQKRAAAIGLHPQLSRALLSSFSDTDYRNAATAIRKALAEAADADKFIWPRQANSQTRRLSGAFRHWRPSRLPSLHCDGLDERVDHHSPAHGKVRCHATKAERTRRWRETSTDAMTVQVCRSAKRKRLLAKPLKTSHRRVRSVNYGV